jgi:hypothetical protein
LGNGRKLANIVSRDKILVTGSLLLIGSILIYLVTGIILSGMSRCIVEVRIDYRSDFFDSAQCQYTQNTLQDITFRAYIYFKNDSSYPAQLPAHVEIKDPSNRTVFSSDFTGEINASIKPEMLGGYEAIVTTPDNVTVAFGSAAFSYHFGFVGAGRDAISSFRFIAFFPGAVGFLMSIYGIRKALRRKSSLE